MAGEWGREGFPQRRRGLGSGFGDVVRNRDGRRTRSQDLPANRPPFGTSGIDSLIPPGQGEPDEETPGSERWKLDELKALSPDFGPYYLESLPDDPAYYYRGPDRSTRLKAHQFVPDDLGILEQLQRGVRIGGLNKIQFMDYNIKGKVYVRFIKKDSLWVYGHTVGIPLNEYRSFRNSPSKGQAVRYLESYGHGAVGSIPAGVDI